MRTFRSGAVLLGFACLAGWLGYANTAQAQQTDNKPEQAKPAEADKAQKAQETKEEAARPAAQPAGSAKSDEATRARAEQLRRERALRATGSANRSNTQVQTLNKGGAEKADAHATHAVRPGQETPKPTVELKPGEMPAIKFDTMIYDFGRIRSGSDVVHEYWFTNTGNGPLEILQVKPS